MRYWTLYCHYERFDFCTEYNVNLTMSERNYKDCTETQKKYIDKIFKAFNLEIHEKLLFEIYENEPRIIDFSE